MGIGLDPFASTERVPFYKIIDIAESRMTGEPGACSEYVHEEDSWLDRVKLITGQKPPGYEEARDRYSILSQAEAKRVREKCLFMVEQRKAGPTGKYTAFSFEHALVLIAAFDFDCVGALLAYRREFETLEETEE